MSEQSASSRVVAGALLINAIILLVVDLILIIVSIFVDLPHLALLAPLRITSTSMFLLLIVFHLLRK